MGLSAVRRFRTIADSARAAGTPANDVDPKAGGGALPQTAGGERDRPNKPDQIADLA